jgi:hypothetical protein
MCLCSDGTTGMPVFLKSLPNSGLIEPMCFDDLGFGGDASTPMHAVIPSLLFSFTLFSSWVMGDG